MYDADQPKVPAISLTVLDQTHTMAAASEPEAIDLVEPGQDISRASSWLYNGQRLPDAPVTVNQSSTDEEITSYYFEQALNSKFADCQRMIMDNSEDMVCTDLYELCIDLN